VSKNIKRDEKGNPILPGAKTFGSTTRPIGGRRASRATDLKNAAADRIINLLTYGASTDRLARDPGPIRDKKHKKYVDEHNRIAAAPSLVRLAFYYQQLKDYEKELKELEDSGNQRKIDLCSPIIKKQVEETRELVIEIYHEVKDQDKIIKRERKE